MELELASPAFPDGQEIPRRYSAEGADISPPLQWSNVPDGTREFVILCEDADRATEGKADEHPFVHWVIYDISPSVTMLPEGLPAVEHIDFPVEADQGINSFEKIGYSGPAPRPGVREFHRYLFRIFALDTELAVHPGASRAEVLAAMEGHLLNEGLLIGVFRHSREHRAAYDRSAFDAA